MEIRRDVQIQMAVLLYRANRAHGRMIWKWRDGNVLVSLPLPLPYSIYLFVFRSYCCSLFSPCVTRIFCTLLASDIVAAAAAASVAWYFAFAAAAAIVALDHRHDANISFESFFYLHFFMYSIFRSDDFVVCVSSSLLSDGFLCTCCLSLCVHVWIYVCDICTVE